jgi:uncharacterized coiled-coil protein SlyX
MRHVGKESASYNYIAGLEAETTQLKERIAELEAEQHDLICRIADMTAEHTKDIIELQELKSGVVAEFDAEATNVWPSGDKGFVEFCSPIRKLNIAERKTYTVILKEKKQCMKK